MRKRAPWNFMLQPRLMPGLICIVIKGMAPSGRDTTQISSQTVKRKRTKNFLCLPKVKIKQSKLLPMWFKGTRVRPKFVVKLSSAIIHKAPASESRSIHAYRLPLWLRRVTEGSLYGGPEMSLCQAVEAKPELRGRPRDDGASRAVGYPPGGAACRVWS